MAVVLYWTVQLASIADPSENQIRLGQDGTGTALPVTQRGSEPYITGGIYTETTQVQLLVSSTAYDLNWVAYDDVSLTYSAIAKTIFTTEASLPAVVGGMATSELLDQAAFTGKRTYFGTLAVTEARDVAAFAGTMIPKFHVGTFAGTEGQIDTFAAAGTVGAPTGRFGDMAALEQRDTAAFVGRRTYFGTLAATETRDNATFAGVQIPSFSSGTLASEEARDIFAATGTATTGVPVSGGLAVTEARDSAAFSGARTYFGALAATEARDVAAFAGFLTKFVTGTMTALEQRDLANFEQNPSIGRNHAILRDANVGLNVSPEQQWRDGAPRNPDGKLLSTRLGGPDVVNNLTNQRDSNRRQVQLLQAPQATQAQTDIVPGWYTFIDVKAGEWVWCLSRDTIVDDADNPIGQDDVVV